MMRCAVEPYEGSEPYIFVSYAHRDGERVFPIIERLAADGFRIWYDEGIDPGSEWITNIGEHLSGASAVITFLTANSVNSQNCREEIVFARSTRIPLLTVHLENVEVDHGLKLALMSYQAVFKYAYDDEERFFRKVENASMLDVCRKVAVPKSGTQSVAAQQAYAQPAATQQTYAQPAAAQQSFTQPAVAHQPYAQQTYAQPAATQQAFGQPAVAQQAYGQPATTPKPEMRPSATSEPYNAKAYPSAPYVNSTTGQYAPQASGSQPPKPTSSGSKSNGKLIVIIVVVIVIAAVGAMFALGGSGKSQTEANSSSSTKNSNAAISTIDTPKDLTTTMRSFLIDSTDDYDEFILVRSGRDTGALMSFSDVLHYYKSSGMTRDELEAFDVETVYPGFDSFSFTTKTIQDKTLPDGTVYTEATLEFTDLKNRDNLLALDSAGILTLDNKNVDYITGDNFCNLILSNGGQEIDATQRISYGLPYM